MESETCPYCGSPIWICQADANWIEFDMEIRFCKGKQAQDEWDKQEAKLRESDKSQLSAGEFAYPIMRPMTEKHLRAAGIEGDGIPRRADFYKALEGE